MSATLTEAEYETRADVSCNQKGCKIKITLPLAEPDHQRKLGTVLLLVLVELRFCDTDALDSYYQGMSCQLVMSLAALTH